MILVSVLVAWLVLAAELMLAVAWLGMLLNRCNALEER
jgi:hypothetical protein